ncbi:MAG: AbrB/MazE/SpoVT family DNA-binding domain-containing protein [Nanoarchaeota archaeon]
MGEIEITTTSVKGQIVIPQDIRDDLDIKPGTKFAVYGKKDMVILKKIKTPTLEDFEKLVDFGVKFAKEKGIKSEKDVERMIHEARGVK